MGTPVICLVGERVISRQTAAMLEAVGLGEFIAADSAAFVDIGRSWAARRDELNTLRLGLRDRMAASKLTDGAGYAADLEATFKSLWAERLLSP